MRRYANGPVGEVLKNKLENEGIYPLAFWDNGFKQMTNNKGPLHHPEDFSGLQFRIMPSEALHGQFELLGADDRVETFDQVFPVLNNQQLNAQENTFSNIVNKNLHSVQDYLTVSNHGYLGYLVLMNKEFWESLPDEVQITILDVLDEVTAWIQEIAEEVNMAAFEELQMCNCIEIHELTERERQHWEDVLIPLYMTFKKKYGELYIQQLPKFNEADFSNIIDDGGENDETE